MNPVKPDPQDGAHQPDEHEHQVPLPDAPAGDAAQDVVPPLKDVPVAPAPLPDRPL